MKKVMGCLIVAVFATMVMSMDALAAAAKKDNSSSVSGVLSLTKDDKGKIDGIIITTKSGTEYHIDMNGFNQDCSAWDGKQVSAKGDVKDIDGKMILKVKEDIKGPGSKKDEKPKPAKPKAAKPAKPAAK
jgi:hypothetical protein